MQTHMQQWMPSSRRLICEELDEEDESSHQKSSQTKTDQQNTTDQQHLNALPSESSTSIIIEHTDIAISESPLLMGSNHKKKMDI